MSRSIFNIKDIRVCPNTLDREYSNKMLSDFDHDDFAEFVYENCDGRQYDKEPVYKLASDLDDDALWLLEIDYLNYIPSNYSRVYLYGVWEIIKNIPKKNR